MGTKRSQGHQDEPVMKPDTGDESPPAPASTAAAATATATATATAAAPPAAPTAKRQRVSRACDQCRNAREKCDGIRPSCFPCASQNRDCTWQEPNRKRGVQTGYIRTLEASLGWIFDKFPGAEDALHGLIAHQGGQGASLLADRHTASSSRLHRRWMRSTVRKDIDLALSGKTDADNDNNDGPHRGVRGSARDGSAPPSSDGDEGDDIKTLNSTQQDLKNHFTTTSPLAQTSSSQRQSAATTASTHSGLVLLPADSRNQEPALSSPLKLPLNHWRLLDVYFAYTHAWFPIVEKPELLRAAYTYPAEGLVVTAHQAGSGTHAELWAALAMAAHQDFARHADSQPEQPSPDEIYRIARGLIPHENGPFDVGHVNALLLLSQISLGRQDLTAAWILTGLAVRIALRIGLHRMPTISSPTKSRREIHAYMGCFILDSLVASMLGSPPHLKPADMTIMFPAPESDLDEWQPWYPCGGFGSGDAGHGQPPSRNPAHSISSFVALYDLHKVLTTQLSSQDPNRRASNLSNATNASATEVSLVEPLRRHSFREYILTGEPPLTPSPPAYMLRLAYLSIEARISNSSRHPRALAVCASRYISAFGICGLPAIFSSYLYLAGEPARKSSDTSTSSQDMSVSTSLSPELPAAVRGVWDPSSTIGVSLATEVQQSQSKLQENLSPVSTHHPMALHDLLLEEAMKSQVQQQLPTPTSTSYQAEMMPDTSPYHSGNNNNNPNHKKRMSGDVFQPVSSSNLTDYPGDPLQTTHRTAHLENSVMFDHMDLISGSGNSGTMTPSTAQFLAAHRPSFGSTAGGAPGADRDAILDELGLMDRPGDMLESESLFMANLGFPTTAHMTTHYPQDFMGFS